MKKFLCIILLCLLIFTTGCTIHKKSNQINSEQELNLAIEQFQYNNSELKLYAISNFINETEFLGYQGTQAILEGFYTGILHTMPTSFGKLYHYYGEIHFVRLLHLVEHTYDDFEAILDSSQNFFPEGNDFIDKLWGYYYATGDERVIKVFCKIQKHDFNSATRNRVKRQLETNQSKFPNVEMKCY